MNHKVQQSPKRNPPPGILPLLPKTTPQGLEGGFWRTDGHFNPILHLKNVLLKQPLDVTPELFFADGTGYVLSAVHLEPAGVVSIDIRAVLEDEDMPEALKPHISAYGMVGISYQWSWAAVMASVQNTDEITSLSALDKPTHSYQSPLFGRAAASRSTGTR